MKVQKVYLWMSLHCFREHLEILNEFEGIVPKEELQERRDELYRALPTQNLIETVIDELFCLNDDIVETVPEIFESRTNTSAAVKRKNKLYPVPSLHFRHQLRIISILLYWTIPK